MFYRLYNKWHSYNDLISTQYEIKLPILGLILYKIHTKSWNSWRRIYWKVLGNLRVIRWTLKNPNPIK